MSALTTHSDSLLGQTLGQTPGDRVRSDIRSDSVTTTPGLGLVGAAPLGVAPRPAPTVERTAPTPIPTGHHARTRLHEVEQMLLAMWTSALPDLDSARSAHLCAAHRAVHEAMLLLDDGAGVVADTGPYPGER